MANPEVIDIAKNQWVNVATNVFTGTISIKDTRPTYSQTYRLTGESAPTSKDEGVRMFANSINEQISSSVGIDVYIWADNKTYDGQVRVDV